MSGRRGNSEGSITKRPDGRWEARISLEGGKRKSVYAKTRQEVARRLAEMTRDRDKGLPIVGERQTVGDFLTDWLANVKPTVRYRSWERYEQYVRLHIIPTLGAVALSKLTAQHVQRLYAKKLQEGSSPTSVSHLHTMFKFAMTQAQRLGLVQRNVVALVRPPHMLHPEMQVLSPDQARALLDAAVGDPLEALYVLALTTGMRRGEILALKWREVNLDQAYLQVRASLQKTPEGFVFTDPKTASGKRKVALTPMAVAALRQHWARQRAARSALGEVWQNLDLVFPNSIGSPLQGTNLLKLSYWRLLAKAGLPRIRFHDLRHTAATLMLVQDVHPKVVAEMLGHTNISITLGTYSHVLPDMQSEATSALERLLARRPPTEDPPGQANTGVE